MTIQQKLFKFDNNLNIINLTISTVKNFIYRIAFLNSTRLKLYLLVEVSLNIFKRARIAIYTYWYIAEEFVCLVDCMHSSQELQVGIFMFESLFIKVGYVTSCHDDT